MSQVRAFFFFFVLATSAVLLAVSCSSDSSFDEVSERNDRSNLESTRGDPGDVDRDALRPVALAAFPDADAEVIDSVVRELASLCVATDKEFTSEVLDAARSSTETVELYREAVDVACGHRSSRLSHLVD